MENNLLFTCLNRLEFCTTLGVKFSDINLEIFLKFRLIKYIVRSGSPHTPPVRRVGIGTRSARTIGFFEPPRAPRVRHSSKSCGFCSYNVRTSSKKHRHFTILLALCGCVYKTIKFPSIPLCRKWIGKEALWFCLSKVCNFITDS
jgi:hypothetical protein